MKRYLFAAPLLAIPLVIAACGGSDPTATPRPAPVAPLSLNVTVGNEDVSQGAEINAFLPGNLTVNEGDTIVFAKKTNEAHTVTFNPPSPPPAGFIPSAGGKLEANPVVFFPSPPPPPGPPPAGPPKLDMSVNFDGSGYVHSGIMLGTEDVMKVTFTKGGSYPYVCLVHATFMKGTVTVNQRGAARPQVDYAKQASDTLTTRQAEIRKVQDTAKAPEPVAAADGSRTFVSYAGAGNSPEGVDLLNFFGGRNLTVKAGDKVTWKWEKNSPGTPHTVTFLSGTPPPDLVLPEPQPAGPPKLFVNPKIGAPVPLPPAPYAGSGFFNSGLLLTGGPTPQEYTLQFTQPGTYKYLCLLHDASGMNGTITVQPR